MTHLPLGTAPPPCAAFRPMLRRLPPQRLVRVFLFTFTLLTLADLPLLLTGTTAIDTSNALPPPA